MEEKRSSSKKREAEVMLQRKKPDYEHPGQTITIPYQILDNPVRLGPADWYVERLSVSCAVFFITTNLYLDILKHKCLHYIYKVFEYFNSRKDSCL